ncbi:GMC family oxidoreductase [Bordetella genomosp. 6]|uniref:GMC family oxidoreductase n=1 Tax=Bordetella genomosp. 6 TaxID=463024 RepID=UPI000A28F673|nr:choline dehydrogenase [Bordetella genomosp. 6]ARP75236.1 choline dehydrogenase [Bordetella genomosp. 6]
MDMRTFDYIVVGAGSAGCALAARLVERKAGSVLLLEAGPPDRNMWIHIPIGYGKTMFDPRNNWQFYSEPEPELNGRKIYQPRGKTLGGSSSINGLVYIRGQAEDFDDWARLGNPGWAWRDVLPLFKRAERNERGDSEFHGGAGRLGVSDIRGRHELVEAFIEAGQENGIARTNDFNGASQEGVGYFQLTTRGGLRCSSAKGYLGPLKGDANLTIETDAQATGLVFEGRRATGVRYRQRGAAFEARAAKEVILAAGAFQSPQLLMLAGIGDGAQLQAHGIPVLHHLPEVGMNLQDHLQVRLIYKCTRPITTNDQLRTLWGRAAIGMRWIFRRSGPVAAGIQLGAMFARACPDATRPDVQFHFGTISADMAAGKPHDFSGFTISMCQLRPRSRGQVSLKSADPLEAPRIQPNYFSAQEDRDTMVAGLRLTRRLTRSRPLAAYIAEEYHPGPRMETEEDMVRFVRESGTTIFHPVGTCRMGGDEASVVDPSLRVRGVQGLRVADASIMPLLLSGNTNAGAIMIGEKAADLITQART